MPRRVADYEPIADFERWNRLASLGYVVLVASMVPFVVNVVRSLRQRPTVGADPWHAYSLEWATTSPPPEHNFSWLPPIRSERPVFDFRWINYDDVGAAGTTEAWEARQQHDGRWLPLHQWTPRPDQEPTAASRPFEQPGRGQRPVPGRPPDGDGATDGGRS